MLANGVKRHGEVEKSIWKDRLLLFNSVEHQTKTNFLKMVLMRSSSESKVQTFNMHMHVFNLKRMGLSSEEKKIHSAQIHTAIGELYHSHIYNA